MISLVSGATLVSLSALFIGDGLWLLGCEAMERRGIPPDGISLTVLGECSSTAGRLPVLLKHCDEVAVSRSAIQQFELGRINLASQIAAGTPDLVDMLCGRNRVLTLTELDAIQIGNPTENSGTRNDISARVLRLTAQLDQYCRTDTLTPIPKDLAPLEAEVLDLLNVCASRFPNSNVLWAAKLASIAVLSLNAEEQKGKAFAAFKGIVNDNASGGDFLESLELISTLLHRRWDRAATDCALYLLPEADRESMLLLVFRESPDAWSRINKGIQVNSSDAKVSELSQFFGILTEKNHQSDKLKQFIRNTSTLERFDVLRASLVASLLFDNRSIRDSAMELLDSENNALNANEASFLYAYDAECMARLGTSADTIGSVRKVINLLPRFGLEGPHRRAGDVPTRIVSPLLRIGLTVDVSKDVRDAIAEINVELRREYQSDVSSSVAKMTVAPEAAALDGVLWVLNGMSSVGLDESLAGWKRNGLPNNFLWGCGLAIGSRDDSVQQAACWHALRKANPDADWEDSLLWGGHCGRNLSRNDWEEQLNRILIQGF